MSYKTVPWPEKELVPNSLDQALSLGWGICGDEGEGDFNWETTASETATKTGEFYLEKKVGNIYLRITVPFTAKYNLQPANSPQALVWALTPPEGTKPELQLFDVIYNWPSSGIRRTIRVEAFDEDDALSVADNVFFENTKNDTAEVRKPDARRRKVHRDPPDIVEATRQRIMEGRR